MEITTNVPIDIDTYISRHDGVVVIQVNTWPNAGNVRINLNDSPVWDGDPEKNVDSSADLVTLCNYLKEVFIPTLADTAWYAGTISKAVDELRQEFPELLGHEETP